MTYIAIDPSKDNLVCYDGTKAFTVPNRPDGWEKILQRRPEKVYIEGALTFTTNLSYFLLQKNIEVYDVSAFKNARLREILTENKTDKIDAESLHIVARYSRTYKPDIGKVQLRLLIELYNVTRNIHATNLQRLHQYLFLAWGPEYKKIFSKTLTAKWIFEFLEKHPVPDENFREDLPRRKRNIEIHVPEVLFKDNLIMLIHTAVKYIKESEQDLRRIERKIREIVQEEQPVLLSLPNMPLILAAMITAYATPERFGRRDQFIAYCGLAPRIYQTGNQPVRRLKRRFVNRAIRDMFFMYTLLSIQKNEETKKYFEKKKKRKKGRAALWATARQLAKLVWKAMKT